MLTKLAFKNVTKSFKDYAVYFFTLVFGVCIFYMFNSIYAQQDIMVVTQSTNEAMASLNQILGIVSIFVSIVLGFLIVYANNFFIKRRKKELGIYMTLGMEKQSISRILILETSLMAILALAVGLVLGIFLSQFMSVFTAKIFEADMSHYTFIFAPDAALKSIVYFGLIFVIVILFNTAVISRLKLIDLIQGGRKNEALKVKSIRVSTLLCVFSLMLLAIAYYLILTNGMLNLNIFFGLSIVLGTLGTFLFFFSLTGLLIRVVQNNKKLYFNKLNIFVLRQLNSKINTNFISLSVVCLVLLLTIGIFSSGYSMQNVVSNELRNTSQFDVSLYDFEGETSNSIYERLPQSMTDEDKIKEWHEHKVYTKEGLVLSNLGITLKGKMASFESLPLQFISLSDYNKILKLQGLPNYVLDYSHYALITNNEYVEELGRAILNEKATVKLEGNALLPMPKVLKTYTHNSFDTLLFVVPDQYVEGLTIDSTTLNIQCTNEAAAETLNRELRALYNTTSYDDRGFVYYESKIDLYQSAISTKALISFLAIYLGLVFMITCAAILAIQQLSEAEDNKQRYKLLAKLGADEKMLNRALLIQVACYFVLPLLLAVCHSIVGLMAANKVIKLLGEMDILGSIMATAIFVIVIYGAYFGLTYMGSKNIISKD